MSCATREFLCTKRYTSGRGSCAITAIVLRNLGMGLEAYLQWIADPIRMDRPTTDPKSVHFIVATNGQSYRVVDERDTAYGVDSFDGAQYPGIMSGCGNQQFIYVGVEAGNNLTNCSSCSPNTGYTNAPIGQYQALVNVLCCLVMQYNLPVDGLRIITENDINSSLTTIHALPTTLLADVQGCVLRGGQLPIPTVGDLEGRIKTLEECCTTVKTAIAALQATATPPSDIADIKARLTALEARVDDIANVTLGSLRGDVDSILRQITSLTNILQDHQACIDKVCPKPNSCLPIHYTLTPNQAMLLTPNVPVRVNFKNKVDDTIPDSVLTGPLWTANLTCECHYSIEVTVGLEPSEYCAGKVVWVDVVACGDTYRVKEQVMGGGNDTVSLTGAIPLTVPPTCNDVHVMVGHNDVTTPFKVLRYADIQIRCI